MIRHHVCSPLAYFCTFSFKIQREGINIFKWWRTIYEPTGILMDDHNFFLNINQMTIQNFDKIEKNATKLKEMAYLKKT